MPESAEARIRRLLSMVPWLMANSGVTVAEAASHFGISASQMLSDLRLLIVIGRDSFIDIWFWHEEHIEEGDSDVRDDPSAVIRVNNPQGFDRPLRFNDDEIATLATQLQLLNGVYGHISPAFESVAEKFLIRLGLTRPSERTTSSMDRRRTPLDVMRTAIQSGACVFMRYASDSRDTVTERTIQPIRIANVADLTYVEGWTHGSTDTALKRYRIDRIIGCGPSNEPPSDLAGVDLAPRELHPTSGMELRVRIAPGNAWLLEEHAFHDIASQPGGSTLASIFVGDSHDYAVRWGLQYAGFATVIEPHEVSADVRVRARAALSLYADGVMETSR